MKRTYFPQYCFIINSTALFIWIMFKNGIASLELPAIGLEDVKLLPHHSQTFANDGALDVACRMSILRKSHVPCHYFCNVPVDLKMVPCRMSILRNIPCHVAYIFPRVTIGSMSHVDFKNWPCRRVKFRLQEPQ